VLVGVAGASAGDEPEPQNSRGASGAAMKDKKLQRAPAEVVALPDADQASDAVKFILEAAAKGTLRGVIIATVIAEGPIDIRHTGDVTLSEMCWTGAKLTLEALT
jgi:hypothetical protein